MMDDLLRETFARHEADAPRPEELRAGIDRLATRRRRRRTALLTGGTAAAVALVLVAVSAFVRLLAPNVPTVPLLPGILGTVPDRALNFLVLGIDDAPGIPTPYRSDSITVVHLSHDRKTISLVDFERDLWVELPGHGPGKLNTAYPLGGAELATAAVHNLTGVAPDATVVVSLGGLGELIDALAPVHMCIVTEITSIHTGQTYPVGCYDIDADAAIDLVRQRTGLGRGSYDRNELIQDVMVALLGRAIALDLFADADRIAALARLDGITVNAPGLDLVALGGQVWAARPYDLFGIVAPRFQPHPDGEGEQLDPTVAPELFAALRDDAVGEFVVAHPDWVSPDLVEHLRQ